MIFILHYILLNTGLPAIITLMALFLHTHSDASLSEIGALLMALPFVSIVTKPLFCALADRHRAHKHYLMAGLAIMALGYGSLAVAPFFPAFVAAHGRLVWYLDVVGVVVGFVSFGVVWSLGDALAVNGAQMAGVPWGSYRLWAVVSWGVFGAIIGLINELPFTPAYVPGLLLLVASLLAEVALLALWPNERFIMCAHLDAPGAGQPEKVHGQQQVVELEESVWPCSRSRRGTITASTGGTLNADARVFGALTNALMGDVGDTVKSTLKLSGARTKGARKGLDELLEGAGERAEWAERGGCADRPPAEQQVPRDQKPPAADQHIQMLLLKLIVRRDKTIGKYLVWFTLFGFLMMCHISYFYMHVRDLCGRRGDNFALVSGAMMLSHTVSEVSSFILVTRYTRLVGRCGALMTCAALYLLRFLYYGLLLERLATCYAVPFEFCHGLAYGIVYSLICDIAVECVDQVDEFLPELVARGLVRADIRPAELKAPLRATMQGVFSGAYDGLGNGLGALFGGVFLDAHPFEQLWRVCAGVCAAILVVCPLAELRLGRRAAGAAPS